MIVAIWTWTTTYDTEEFGIVAVQETIKDCREVAITEIKKARSQTKDVYRIASLNQLIEQVQDPATVVLSTHESSVRLFNM